MNINANNKLRYVHFAKGTCSVAIPEGATAMKGGGEDMGVVFLDDAGRVVGSYVSRAAYGTGEIYIREIDPTDEAEFEHSFRYIKNMPSTPIAAPSMMFGGATFDAAAFPPNRLP